MIKESYTDAGKVWDGGISPVPGDVSDAIEEFVKDTNWTGGKRKRLSRLSRLRSFVLLFSC